jgi:hypothetical protein
MSRDSSVGIALGYGLDDRGSRVRFPEGAGNFSLHHRVQNGSGAHPDSYPTGNRGSFPGGKAAGKWSWPLTSIYAEVKECVELYLHSPIYHGMVLRLTLLRRTWSTIVVTWIWSIRQTCGIALWTFLMPTSDFFVVHKTYICRDSFPLVHSRLVNIVTKLTSFIYVNSEYLMPMLQHSLTKRSANIQCSYI